MSSYEMAIPMLKFWKSKYFIVFLNVLFLKLFTIFYRYKNFYGDLKTNHMTKWLAYEKTLAIKNIKDFDIQVKNQDLFVAFNCFSFEYTVKKHNDLDVEESKTVLKNDRENRIETKEATKDTKFFAMDQNTTSL